MREVRDKVLEFEEDMKGLFLGWFNNHMAMFLMAVQQVKPRDPKIMMRIEFFLHDLEHHYLNIHASRRVTHAFRWLRRYIKVYPQVNAQDSERAVEMIGRIYGGLGIRFTYGMKPVSHELSFAGVNPRRES